MAGSRRRLWSGERLIASITGKTGRPAAPDDEPGNPIVRPLLDTWPVLSRWRMVLGMEKRLLDQVGGGLEMCRCSGFLQPGAAWVFQDGYWDRTLEDRGTLFVPAEVDGASKGAEDLTDQLDAKSRRN